MAGVDLTVSELTSAEAIFLSVFKLPCVDTLISVFYRSFTFIFEFEKFTFEMLEIAFEDISAEAAKNIISPPAN